MGENAPVSAVEAIEKAMRDHIKVDATGLSPAVASAYVVGFDEAAKAVSEIAARQAEALKRAITELLGAKALDGIRGLVAGWNGEHLPESERFGRHHEELGVTLPTNCGAIYELDAAMTRARTLLKGAGDD